MFDINNKLIDKLSKRYGIDMGTMTLPQAKEVLTLHEYTVFILSIKYPNDSYREIIKHAIIEERKERLKGEVVSIKEGEAINV
tara:strand:- start:353 stop:601 length:249 start_codon:yes stop_codon:yes gene_type:complete